uniref:Uncharacterized protein n=1 Tax=Gadus morhua TaxID=8049 RepID=A0A8C5AGS5_GADMO
SKIWRILLCRFSGCYFTPAIINKDVINKQLFQILTNVYFLGLIKAIRECSQTGGQTTEPSRCVHLYGSVVLPLTPMLKKDNILKVEYLKKEERQGSSDGGEVVVVLREVF